MANPTITDDTFDAELKLCEYLVDMIQHACALDELTVPDDRAPEVTALDFQINNLKMWWPADTGEAQLRGFKRHNQIAHRLHTAWLNDQADSHV